MNYYEHHIRDYDAATAHLTWDQDMAYSRLLRWYYRKEQPIPADIAEACRQVRASSKPQRDAVEAVLREFFVLHECLLRVRQFFFLFCMSFFLLE